MRYRAILVSVCSYSSRFVAVTDVAGDSSRQDNLNSEGRHFLDEYSARTSRTETYSFVFWYLVRVPCFLSVRLRAFCTAFNASANSRVNKVA